MTNTKVLALAIITFVVANAVQSFSNYQLQKRVAILELQMKELKK